MSAPEGFDAEAAARFVGAARSRFCQLAIEWLETWDDPVDLLFVLSSQTSQSLGPWETFRFCALLGLVPAGAVRELGLDVLVEPLNPRDPTKPVSHACALAQAIKRLEGEEAPYALEVLDALATGGGEVPEVLVAAARFGLASVIGDPRAAEARPRLVEELRAEKSPFVASCLEAALLAEDEALIEMGRAALARVQEDDGTVYSGHSHPVLKALATLRALCLIAPWGER